MKTAGLNALLDNTFGSGCYVGLIRDDGYTDLGASGDTLASHANWQEGDEYTGNRPAFTTAPAASGSITNSASVASFAIDDTETMKGFFVCTAASGTSGTLHLNALFESGDVDVVSGNTLEVTVTITAS